ncbi:right-handed parallel beta-helix repeat-containing protein [Streptacidiphilus sp. PAMC 29251]
MVINSLWRRVRREEPGRRPVGRTGALVAAMGIGVALTVSGPAAAATPPAVGHRYYVDCASGRDTAAGTSPQAAWRTLARVDAVTFRPGDSILLRSGTTCVGVLSPHGSGSAGHPIVVSSYGAGARPAINGAGAPEAVFLDNVQQWEIRGLDVSDPAAPDGTPRIGIYVLLDDFGTGSHFVIDDVDVHDVVGVDSTGPDAQDSGGIVFKAAGSTVPTGFDGIKVLGSTVSGTDGYGIATESQWSLRTLFPGGENSFVPITHVLVSGNRLTDMGGDGIVIQNGDNPLVEHNVVDGFGLRATAYHAGIWAWNSDHPVMQYNDVSHGATAPPAMAFDIDGADSDVVYQYNYSHDNGGGFLALCDVPGEQTVGATVRYNLSQNDHDDPWGSITVPVISNGCGLTEPGVSFYDNVVYAPTATALIGNFGDTSVAFTNNVFHGKPGGSTIQDPVGVFDHNIYENIASVPAGEQHAVTGNPLFTDAGSGPLGYALSCGSPAVGAGAAIAGSPKRDFYGAPVPVVAPLNIGLSQGPCRKR